LTHGMKVARNPGALVSAVLLLLVFFWAYLPTARELIHIWSTQADYSHGFLVVPLALLFLYLRRDLRPARIEPRYRDGLLLMLLSLVIRIVGLRYSFDSLDGYSLVCWLCGAVLLVWGRAYFVWMLPSLLFLLFMVPLPFQLERLLSVPLQRVATTLSCFILQSLGQPAFAEGTTIMIGTHQLFVEQACSGLRMFVGAFALAFAFLIATRRELWEQTLLLASVVPISLLANALRIAATGLLYQYVADEATVQQWSHDLAGIFMIPLAAAMFAGVLWYMSHLFRAVETMTMEEVMGRERLEDAH
ncbi:MAG: exosortase/archaeosortase family protein, partial [Planctomycetales bacterium]|nr:exosortase/archaeosortase family protein [Planctomycetales bacterium]